MRRNKTERQGDVSSTTGSEKGSVWTEEVLVIGSATLFAEESGGGKTSYSMLLELSGDPESSRSTRTRTEITLAFGIEEKDISPFARLTGRKVHLGQERELNQTSMESALFRIAELERLLAESDSKVAYLNDSLHRMVQESRKGPQRELS